VFAFSCFQSTVSTTWFLQVARGLSKSYQKHIFFVLFSFESQRLMFYAGTKKTHVEQLENGRRSGTSHGKLTSDIFGNIVTHVNISECCSLVRGHHDFHSTLMKCISLVESSSLDWLLTENEIWIYSLSLSLMGSIENLWFSETNFEIVHAQLLHPHGDGILRSLGNLVTSSYTYGWRSRKPLKWNNQRS